MSVLTTDILLEGMRRDDVLAWLSEPARHGRLLEGAFDGVTTTAPGRYVVTVSTPPRKREMTYTFEHVDEEHGGRRVHVTLGGRRTTGKLHYSLRTMKPAGNTLVTLHADIESGGVLGMLAEWTGLRDRLDKGFRAMLENLKREVAGGVG
jgi:carbon monoxide dehydrogenase subunit G